jgi:hypothetical protein
MNHYMISFVYEGPKCGITPTPEAEECLSLAAEHAEKIMTRVGVTYASWYRFPDGTLEYLVKSAIPELELVEKLTDSKVKCEVGHGVNPDHPIEDQIQTETYGQFFQRKSTHEKGTTP